MYNIANEGLFNLPKIQKFSLIAHHEWGNKNNNNIIESQPCWYNEVNEIVSTEYQEKNLSTEYERKQGET